MLAAAEAHIDDLSNELDISLPPAENLFNRPPRIIRTLPSEEIEIPAPPQSTVSGVTMQLAMVVLPIVTAIMYIVALVARGGQRNNIWMSIPIIGVSVISAGFGIYNYVRQRRIREQQLLSQEQTYNTALQTIRDRLQHLDHAQREVREANDPDLSVLMQLVVGGLDDQGVSCPAPRLWERRPTDDDFLKVCIGRAALPTSIKIKAPQANLLQFTPALRKALELANTFATVENVPFVVALRASGSLGIAGPSGTVLACTRAMLWQIVVHHSPKEVRIAAFWDSRFDSSWEWLRWLPHTGALDGSEEFRLLARLDGPQEPLQQVVDVLTRECQQRLEQPSAAANRPHLIIVIGDYHRYCRTVPTFAQALRSSAALSLTALCLVDEVRQVPGECGGYIDLHDTPTLALAGPNGGYFPFAAHGAERAASSRLARSLAPIMQAETDGRRELPRSVRLLPLLGIDDARSYDPQLWWRKLPEDNWHPIPIGQRSAKEALEINLNEGFDGVHGMIAGTTGSGKSEFLLSFLLALAIKHGPDRVNFMLIDFKGGATFQGLEQLPHTAGVVTDLKGNMAERALIAINSELDRRKQRLARAAQSSTKADVPNIRAYRKHGFEQHPQFGPMPNLLIAIDEFDEMVRDYPEFVTELVRVAKQGRSLGVHLLFATQQPSLIKEGLTRNLTYWIALRVTGADDSKMMVSVPDAAYLTTETPGRGFFRVGKRVVQFQSARVTVPYQPPMRGSDMGHVDVTGRWQLISRRHRDVEKLRDALNARLITTNQPQPQLVDDLTNVFLRGYHALAPECLPSNNVQRPEHELRPLVEAALKQHLQRQVQRSANESRGDTDGLIAQLLELMQGESVREHELALVARAMVNDPATGHGYAAHRYPIWTDPLAPELTLAALMSMSGKGNHCWLHAPIGLLDLPATASQQPCVLDLANHDGNVLVLGSAGAGKTTFVRTLALALATTHNPADLWLYIVDPSGGGCGLVLPPNMANCPKLPHIADAFSPHQSIKVERLLIELQDQVRQRMTLIQQHGVDSLTQLRERSVAIEAPMPPAIVVIIDNVAELNAAQPEAIETLKTLIRDARKCGINFVVTGYSWRDVSSIQSSFETRIALRLNDPTDSDAVIGKSYAARIALDQPGRAFLRTSERPIELQVALPVLPAAYSSEVNDANSIAYAGSAHGLAAALKVLSHQYTKITAGLPQPLRSLSTRVDLAELWEQTPAMQGELVMPVAVDSMTLQPMLLDFASKTPQLLVAGGPRSGKSQLLRTIITGLSMRYTPDDVQFVLVDFRRRVLQSFAELPHIRHTTVTSPPAPGTTSEPRIAKLITNEAEVRALVTDLAAEMNRRSVHAAPHPRIVLVMSNWDLIQDTYSLWKPLAPFILQGRDLGLHLIVTGSEYSSFASTDMLKMARLERCAIFLGQPAENSTVPSTLGMKLPRQAAQTEMPPGRGYFSLGGHVHLVQFAFVSHEAIVPGNPI